MTKPADNPASQRDFHRIVVKLGTQVVMGEDGLLALDRLFWHVNACAAWMRAGREVLLVSSGAVGLGRRALGLPTPSGLPEKQACAAVGQSLLMETYRDLFARQGITVAQVLLTSDDFSDRQRYLNLRETLEKLLQLGVAPIINENDTVSTAELREDGHSKSFGDNDQLSSLVAAKLDADLLVILTNVDGVYTDNPFLNPAATPLRRITRLEELTGIGTEGQSAGGRGGIVSKIRAARIASISGVHTLIASGLQSDTLTRALERSPESPGTWVDAQETESLSGRKRWIGLASGAQGVLVVNAGARRALLERGASLLAIGVREVQGEFAARQVVCVWDEVGLELGRGVVNFSAADLRKIQGRPSSEFAEALGRKAQTEPDVVIQRNDLVIFESFLS